MKIKSPLKMNWMAVVTTVTVAFALSSISHASVPVPVSVAGEGGHGAANGGGGEPLYHALTVAVDEWLEKESAAGQLSTILHLETAPLGGPISPSDFLARFRDAVKTSRVTFLAEKNLRAECRRDHRALACQLAKNSRWCMNRAASSPEIVCVQERFDRRPGDEQFAIALHEPLGIAGIETNDAHDVSRYEVSKYIIPYAEPQKVVRWALSLQPRVVAPPVSTVGCKVYVQYGIEEGRQINGYTVSRTEAGTDFHLAFDREVYETTGKVEFFATLTHRSGYEQTATMSVRMDELAAHWSYHPSNLELMYAMSFAKTVQQYADLKAKIRPELNQLIPAVTDAEAVLSRVRSCESMLRGNR